MLRIEVSLVLIEEKSHLCEGGLLQACNRVSLFRLMVFFNEYSMKRSHRHICQRINNRRHLSNEISAGLFNDEIFIVHDICSFQSRENLVDRVMRFDTATGIGSGRLT